MKVGDEIYEVTKKIGGATVKKCVVTKVTTKYVYYAGGDVYTRVELERAITSLDEANKVVADHESRMAEWKKEAEDLRKKLQRRG